MNIPVLVPGSTRHFMYSYVPNRRQALINWQGGIFSKFNKRARSNKEAGWNIFSNLIRGQE